MMSLKVQRSEKHGEGGRGWGMKRQGSFFFPRFIVHTKVTDVKRINETVVNHFFGFVIIWLIFWLGKNNSTLSGDFHVLFMISGEGSQGRVMKVLVSLHENKRRVWKTCAASDQDRATSFFFFLVLASKKEIDLKEKGNPPPELKKQTFPGSPRVFGGTTSQKRQKILNCYCSHGLIDLLVGWLIQW